MSNEQKTFNTEQALNQVPESTSNALNVRKPTDTGSPKETQAERDRKAASPRHPNENGIGSWDGVGKDEQFPGEQ